MLMPNTFNLGTVMCPSGVLVIVDLGYMFLWSGEASPQPYFDGTEDGETRARMLTAWDYVIAGRDAERVAKIADIIGFRFLYDWPDDSIKGPIAKVREIAADHGLDASVEREPQRIPHRVRAQRAADRGGEYFEMSGPWVVAIGVPGHPLAVTGERHDFGGNVGVRWSNVTIEVHEGESASSERIGDFGVDYGLALIADADSLGRWRDPEHRDYLYMQIESSELGAGSVRLGDAELLGMSNSWGDGLFPVFADRDADGRLLAVRLQLGDEKRRVLMEQVWERASKR
jgi:hypothetical protein